MVEFQLGPMDRQYYQDFSGPLDPKEDTIEQPIIPLSDLGTTVPETDPVTGANILRNIEANIRKGASKMQIIWMTQHNQPIGGRPKAYGKDVRKAIREMLDANKVEISGFEMPTSSMSNLSGFDGQRWNISEEKRQRDIQEVKDAIDFAVDAAGGGGIDMVSMEFARSIVDSNWNKNKHGKFFDYTEDEIEYEKLIAEGKDPLKVNPEKFGKIESMKVLYDGKTGNVIQDIRKSGVVSVPKWMTAAEIDATHGSKYVDRYDEHKAKVTGNGKITANDYVDLAGNWIDPTSTDDQLRRVAKWNKDKTRFETEQLHWADIVHRTDKWNAEHPDEKMSPEKMAFRLTMEGQVSQARGQSLFYTRQYDMYNRQVLEQSKKLDEYRKAISEGESKEGWFSKEALTQLATEEGLPPDAVVRSVMRFEQARSQKQQIRPEDERMVEKLNFATQKLVEKGEKVYTEQLKQLQHELKHVHEASGAADAKADELLEKIDNVKTLHEIGFANTTASYGELGYHAYKKSQDKKATKDVYVGPELGWPTSFGGHPEEFRQIILKARDQMVEKLKEKEGMREAEAKAVAKKHIKGTFDTSHLAMWYNHFDWKKGESEEQRLKRFNKWFLEETDKLAKDDIIGEVQVVDSITGQHSHLPAGQGIFPVVEAVQRLRKKGFKGAILSEGHEHEKFTPGSTLTENWRAFGSPVGSGYFSGGVRPHTWGGVQHSYFGATQPPTYIVGAYVPSNEWTLWSEVPFE